nr:reverse transcriptase domain-containing protein [Tanacetum cinerariifolium]
ELADRSITSPVGIAKDVYVKTGKALIDVFECELTPRVGKEAITFNLDQTSRYSANYNDMTAKRIDVIDVACEEYSQKVLGFSDTISNEHNSSDYYQPYLDPEVDILLLEAFLNDDPSPPPYQGNYMPEVRKELKICEAHSEKSLVDEPHVAELKELPPHLEYAFLEGDDKLPVIITKDLSVEEKTALITILKSHKRAIAWKLSYANPRPKQMIENLDLDDLSEPIDTMADQRTMAQLLQAPTEEYEDAIVVPAITAENFELKHGLLTLVFFGHDKEDPHAHVHYFNKIT